MNFHPNSTPTPALSPSLSRSRPTIRAYDTVAINLRRFSDSSPVSPIRLIAILENGYFSVRSRDNENLLERESFSRGSIRREFLFLRLILNYKYEKKEKNSERIFCNRFFTRKKDTRFARYTLVDLPTANRLPPTPGVKY